LYYAYNQFDDEDIINEATEKAAQRRYEDKTLVHDGELFDSKQDHDHDQPSIASLDPVCGDPRQTE
jgi:hypothetical protein